MRREATGTEVLVLRALGPCTLELDGEPRAIGGPRPQAVLLRLALAGGHLVTAERLVADLWGDDAPRSVVTTLQGYLSRLRTALGDPRRLRREGPGYVLDLADDEVDLRRFEALVDRATDEADLVPRVELLEEALGLWRGSALVDVADTEWAGPSAVRLEERRLEAIECRFDALLDLGRHATVVPEIEQTVSDHPYRERFTAQLMTALYRCGRQADALRALERARRTLLEEVGLDPSPDLMALEAAILAHDPSLRAPSPPPAAAAGPASPLPGTGGRGFESVPALPPAVRRQAAQAFVGRAQPLGELRTAWQDVVDGQRGLVLLEGEAGAGKSRLAARFAAELHDEGAVVLWGRSAEESILPYGPVVEALRTALTGAPAEVVQRVVDARPGLRSLRPFLVPADDVEEPGPDASGDGGDRYRLFEAVSELVHDESRQAPILFVLDDLQWADPPTLRLLQHLLQHQRPGRVLLLATVRTVPVTENPALDALLWEARRDHLLTRIALDGLSHDEVA
ncbi:MAG TPA: BTAD domain-containing putative transcriptional regulator, partial [Aquihabitans sp.]|nr:BTAD domain-containing putative transcriptional regulator [Aquihabitans sp.]